MKTSTMLLTVATFLVTNAMAETIALRNGKTVEGQIIRTNAVSVTVRTSSGVRTYGRSELQDRTEQPAPSATAAGSQATNATQPAQDRLVDRDRDDMRGFFIHSLLTVRAGQIIWLLGSVLLLIQGFRTSVLWGVLMLLTNLLGAIIFLLFHPKRAIMPLLIMLVGIAVFAMGGGLIIFRLMK